MLILALDAALSRCSAAIIRDGELICQQLNDQPRGQAALLAPMVEAVLTEARVEATSLAAVAVTVGPGSFTGIRAALALAHGFALAAGCKVVGVTVGEAMAEAFPQLRGRRLWTVVDSRRGRVFLDRGPTNGIDDVMAFDLTALPVPNYPVAIAGDAALAVACALAASGADVALTDLRIPLPRHVALAAIRRLAGGLPPRDAQPLYIDPPEAKLPAGGLRPAPSP
jgi:tRNA threonylcarbamoyl adenosine modification protein YeaZ